MASQGHSSPPPKQRKLPTQPIPLMKVNIADLQDGGYRGSYVAARVMSRTPVMTSAGGTKFVKCMLRDATGTIELTLFKDVAEGCDFLLKVNTVIRVEHFSVRQSMFQNVQTFSMTANKSCDISLTLDDSVPPMELNLKSLDDLTPEDSTLDVLGIVMVVGDLAIGTTNGREWKRRDISITDGFLDYAVPVTLWGCLAECYELKRGDCMIIMRAAKTTGDGPISFTTTRFSSLWIHPNLKEALDLSNWFKGEEANVAEEDQEMM